MYRLHGESKMERTEVHATTRIGEGLQGRVGRYCRRWNCGRSSRVRAAKFRVLSTRVVKWDPQSGVRKARTTSLPTREDVNDLKSMLRAGMRAMRLKRGWLVGWLVGWNVICMGVCHALRLVAGCDALLRRMGMRQCSQG
jgi:hypothetical protein